MGSWYSSEELFDGEGLPSKVVVLPVRVVEDKPFFATWDDLKTANARSGEYFFGEGTLAPLAEHVQMFAMTIEPELHHGRFFLTTSQVDGPKSKRWKIREIAADGQINVLKLKPAQAFKTKELALTALRGYMQPAAVLAMAA